MPNLRELDVEEYLIECVRVEPTALEEEFYRIASDIAFWNERHARFHRAALLAKVTVRRVEGACATEQRQAWREAHLKFTESELSAKVSTDERLIEVLLALAEAEAEAGRLKGVIEALRTKRDMLIQLGSDRRAEMQGDPIIRSEARAIRAMRESGR